jgi:hypothetical protein
LDLVGLSAGLPDYISDVIYEMHKIRNVYAHCGGRADKQFLTDCPWFNINVGESIPLNREMVDSYINVLSFYSLVLMRRGFARVGIRLVGDEYNPYWDPKITVSSVSQEAYNNDTASMLKCIAILPVIQARHSKLYKTQPQSSNANGEGERPMETTSVVKAGARRRALLAEAQSPASARPRTV